MEPIDDCVVDQSREFLRSVSEVVTDRGEAQSHVKVSLDTVNEELPAVFFVVENAFALDGTSDTIDDAIDILNREEISDLTGGEQIIDEDKETLVGDLTFSEEEHESLILLARL